MFPQALVAVRVLLSLFFVLAGIVKVTDLVSADVHKHMRQDFSSFSAVFPLARWGWVPNPGLYMAWVGWSELILGVLLSVGPTPLRVASAGILSVVMIGAIYSLLSLGLPVMQCVPASVCLVLLTLLLICKPARAQKPEPRVKSKSS